MSSVTYPFRKSNQIKRYLGQCMRALSGFQHDDGKGGVARVPVVYGDMSRIVATILNNRDEFSNSRVPMLAVALTGLVPDVNSKRNNYHQEYVPNFGDSNPDTRTMAQRLIGPAFVMELEVALYANSTIELFEIAEQLLLTFNPRIPITIDTNVVSGNYITELALENVNYEVQFPLGTENKTRMMTFSFTAPIRLSYPHGISDGLIQKITTNVIDENNNETVIEEDIE